MNLSDYAKATGRGVTTRLMRRSGLAYSTVRGAVLQGRAVRYDTARKLSLATDGAVSIEEIDLLGDEAVLPSDDDDAAADIASDDVRRSSAA